MNNNFSVKNNSGMTVYEERLVKMPVRQISKPTRCLPQISRNDTKYRVTKRVHSTKTPTPSTNNQEKNSALLLSRTEVASNIEDDLEMSGDDEIPATMPFRQTCKPSRYLPSIPPKNIKHRVAKQTSNTKTRTTLSIKKQEKKSALLMTLLNRDCRFMIFDAITDQESTVQMAPNYQANGLIKALSQTSKNLRDEIKEWSQRRPDLVTSTTFGLYNPFLTSFDFCFSAKEVLEYTLEGPATKSKVHRVYHPSAAMKHQDILHLWQRAMTYERYRPSGSGYDAGWNALLARELLGGCVDPTEISESLRGVAIMPGQHADDGVIDQLVLNRGDKQNENWREVSALAEQLQDESKLSVVWTDKWEEFFDHRRIIELEK